MNHWMPRGWHLIVNGPKPARWSIYAEGIPVLRGQSPDCRQADRDAVAALMRAVRDRLDNCWTPATGARVHAVIKGQPRAICGCRDLGDGPDTQKIETPPCGRCERILTTIERLATDGEQENTP